MFAKITTIVMVLCLIPASAFDASAAIGAIGQKVNYADAWPSIDYETDITVAVGVHDQRPYVVNGEKNPTYAGTIRAGYGNPWNVNTESDKPLSDDITSAVVSGFMGAGIKAVSVPIPFSDNHQTALEKLKRMGTKRIVIINLFEWRSDSYRSVGFFINALLQIYDGEGKELASSTASHKSIGSGDGSVESIDDAARLYLNKLLNDPKVKAVLSYKLTDEEKVAAMNSLPASLAVIEIGRDDRFVSYNNGTVKDTKTGLMWAAVDNRADINWDKAKSYCQNYRWGGYKDWRMPTQEELAGLYDKSKRYTAACGYYVFLTPLIRLTCTLVWAAESRGTESASLDFNPGYRKLRSPADAGGRNWTEKSVPDYNRVLPVRSAK